MNILIITSGLHVIGGAQVFIFRLFHAFRENNLNVKLITLDILTEEQQLHIRKNLGVDFYALSATKISQFIEKVLFRLRLSYVIEIYKNRLFKLLFNKVKKEFSGDILINSHLIAADLFLVNQDLSNCKVVSCPHGEYNIPYLKDVGYNSEFVIEKLHSIIDGIIYLHDSESSIIPRLTSENPNLQLTKIYNGLDTKSYVESYNESLEKSKDFIYLMVARGEESKGWKQVVDAFCKIRHKSNRNQKLILVGDSQHIQDLKKEYESNDIIFSGYTDPRPLYEIASCFVFPTYFPGEALPNVIVEAMAYSLPIISSKNAEIPLMIDSDSGSCGIALNIQQDTGTVSVDELAEVMLEFQSNHEMFSFYKNNCKSAFNKFRMDFCLDSYINFFKKVHVRN